jgi:hypothetical protein
MIINANVFFLFSPIQLYFIKDISREYQYLRLKIFCLARHKNAVKQFHNVSESLGLKKIVVYNTSTIFDLVLLVATLFFHFPAKRMTIGNYNSKIYRYASRARGLTSMGVDILDEGSNIYLFNKRLPEISKKSQVLSFSRFACLNNPGFRHVSPSLADAKPSSTGDISDLLSCKFLIIGSADVAEGLVTSRTYLEKVKKISKLGVCAYYPHRRENVEIVRVLPNIRIIDAEYPFEHWFMWNFSNNRSFIDGLILISFGSTCVTICSELYPSSKWLILKYTNTEILESYLEEYSLIIDGLVNDVKLNKGVIHVVE